MNNTLYQQLSDLGFGEWLEKNYNITNDYPITWADGLTINHLMRTVFNSLAFRWLREEKGILLIVSPVDDWHSWTFIILAKDLMSPFFQAYPTPTSEIPEYETCELSEHEALNKAVEILSKGGNHGN